MRTLAYSILWVIALFSEVVQGTSIDGSINLTHRPSLKFSEALSIGTKALEGDAKSFACTIAHSKTKSSGGGWDLQFRSRTLPYKWVNIDRSGKVTWKQGIPGLVAPIKAVPRVPIEKAIETALARDKPGKWHAVFAEWREEKDEWFLVLVNSHRDAVDIIVDNNGKAREQKRER